MTVTQLEAASDLVAAAQRALEHAQERRDELIRAAVASGWTQLAVAEATGLSGPRVAQIAPVWGPRPTRVTMRAGQPRGSSRHHARRTAEG